MKKIILSGAIVMLFTCGFASNVNAASLTSASTIVSTASDNWDKLLDEYEKYVDQYIKTYKKAMSGDMAAMAEYAKLAEKAEKLTDKIDKAKGEMSNAQRKRYMKITQKMIDALK